MQMSFSHNNTINILVGVISGLKYTKPGGVFILHFYSIINKSYANLYLFCKQWFENSNLYLPECINEFKQYGTYGIFTGFKGVPESVMQQLDAMIFNLKKIYKNGDFDANIYDPELRKLCNIYKFFSESEKLPYISYELFLDSNEVQQGHIVSLDNSIYKEVIDFNTKVYARKLEFCSKVNYLWKNVPYPELAITDNQYSASVKYLKKWHIPYTYAKQSGESKPKIISMKKLMSTRTATTSESNSSNKFTYKVVSDFMNMDMVDNEFKARGNWIPYDPKSSNKLDFFFIDSNNIDDTTLWTRETGLKNLIGDSKKTITNKLNLYNNLKDIPGTARFLPKTIPFNISGKTIGYLDRFKGLFKNGQPYICKIVDVGAGKGIICTDKFHEFREFMSKYFNILNKNPRAHVKEWVLQEYITNPFLMNGRKFHIRQLFFYQPGDKQSYYMYHSRVAIAEAPYKHGDWTNKDIHDTHFHKYHGVNWPFQMKFSQAQWSKLKDQLEFIYASLISVIKGDCYAESRNCFEVLGVDLMLTDKMDFKLIEVNDKIGMSGTPDYNKKVFQGILTCIVDKYYKPKYNQLVPGDFIKINWLNLSKSGKFYSNAPKIIELRDKINSNRTSKISSRSSGSRATSYTRKHLASKQQKQYSYLVRTDYFTDEYIDNCFKSRGNWIKITDNQLPEYKHKPIDFIYIDGLNYINSKYYGLTTNLKNTVNDDKQTISLKHNLITNLAKSPGSAKFIMPTMDVDLLDYSYGVGPIISTFFRPGKLYIFKPVSGMAGQGIKVVSNFHDLEKYMLEIIRNHKYKWHSQTKSAAAKAKEQLRVWVLQEYITNPLLFTENGQHYKFHIRHFYLYQPGNKPSYYKNAGKIAIAKKPYVSGKWDNPDIHDTHFHGNSSYSWPESTNLTPQQLVSVNSQICEFYTYLDSHINAGCYSESKFCYELFGVDLMITDDYKLKVLEVNAGLGLGNNTSASKEELFNGILELIVDPRFQPINKELILSVADKFTMIEKPKHQK
jgi:tubulin polyglutamylase TTLL9